MKRLKQSLMGLFLSGVAMCSLASHNTERVDEHDVKDELAERDKNLNGDKKINEDNVRDVNITVNNLDRIIKSKINVAENKAEKDVLNKNNEHDIKLDTKDLEEKPSVATVASINEKQGSENKETPESIETKTTEADIVLPVTDLEEKTQETKYATIVIDGNEIPMSGFFEKSNKETIEQIQKFIDTGKAAVAFNKINHFDNKPSLMFGHNPGVMSPIAKVAKEGKVITVYDINGVSKEYVMHKLAFQKQGGVANEAVQKKLKSSEEGIVIQFCIENGIDFWWAVPRA